MKSQFPKEIFTFFGITYLNRMAVAKTDTTIERMAIFKKLIEKIDKSEIDKIKKLISIDDLNPENPGDDDDEFDDGLLDLIPGDDFPKKPVFPVPNLPSEHPSPKPSKCNLIVLERYRLIKELNMLKNSKEALESLIDTVNTLEQTSITIVQDFVNNFKAELELTDAAIAEKTSELTDLYILGIVEGCFKLIPISR